MRTTGRQGITFQTHLMTDYLRAGIPLLLLLCASLNGRGRLRITFKKFRKGATGIGRVSESSERHTELQKIIRCLGVVWILLVGLGEDDSRLLVISTHIIGLTQPVLGISCEGVFRILLDKTTQSLLRLIVLRLPQKTEGVIVLFLGRATRQGTRRSGLCRTTSSCGSRLRLCSTCSLAALEILQITLIDHAQCSGRTASLLGRRCPGGRPRRCPDGRSTCPADSRWRVRSDCATIRLLLKVLKSEINVGDQTVEPFTDLIYLKPKLLDLTGQGS